MWALATGCGSPPLRSSQRLLNLRPLASEAGMQGGLFKHDDVQSPLPICVTGMHRSGTSVVAGILHRHGLWLGDPADMMAANPYNPDGYFENDRMVDLNNSILELFGGTWSSPPRFASRWMDDPRLDEVKVTARELGVRLAAGHQMWGFKDPRAALTLPFWLSVWSGLTVVVTVRNPLETARSLNRRDNLTLQQGTALWSAHYRSILGHTTPATRIVVEYEAFCADPIGSAAALLSRLPGLRETDSSAARASVRPPLRHFRETVANLQAWGAPVGLLELYAQLQGEAIQPTPAGGSGSGAALDQELVEVLRGLPAALSGLDLAIRDVHVDLQRLAAVVSRLSDEVGFVRTADLAGIAAQLDHQRGNVERMAAALPPVLEHSVNGTSG